MDGERSPLTGRYSLALIIGDPGDGLAREPEAAGIGNETRRGKSDEERQAGRIGDLLQFRADGIRQGDVSRGKELEALGHGWRQKQGAACYRAALFRAWRSSHSHRRQGG